MRISETTHKGIIAEAAIEYDLLRRGFDVCLPIGTSHDWDLIFTRDGQNFERVQVKYAKSINGVIPVRTRTHSNTSAKQVEKKYTADMIDWLAVYEPDTKTICYVPSAELGGSILHIRIAPLKRASLATAKWAREYASL